jgi:hypothetical protein
MRCNATGNLGICDNVPVNEPDSVSSQPCDKTMACNGKGGCKSAPGQSCYNSLDCASGHCVDKVCCRTACDKTCETCSLDVSSSGTCKPVPQGKNPDKECLGKDVQCGGLCDGKGQCDFPGAGTTCGKCMACDGTGQCNATPKDDSACGVIDCDKLDTACRDYADLTQNRCASYGTCKKPNESASCTVYKDLPCTDGGLKADGRRAEAGPAGDAGGPGQAPDEGGCGCAVPSRRRPLSPSLLSLLLPALLLCRPRSTRTRGASSRAMPQGRR